MSHITNSTSMRPAGAGRRNAPPLLKSVSAKQEQFHNIAVLSKSWNCRKPWISTARRRKKMSNVYEEWQKLCEEHEAARMALNAALAPVSQKFSANSKGSTNVNISGSEIDRLDPAWEDWEDIKKRMKDFVNTHR